MGIVNVRKQDKYLCGPEAEQDLRTVKETEAPAPLGSGSGSQQWHLRSHNFRMTRINSASP